MVIDYIPKYGLLASGHENGEIYIWDIDIGTMLKVDNKKMSENTICAFAHICTYEFTYLISAGYNSKIYVWELNEKKSASLETLVYPQLKMNFFGDPTIEKENIVGNEVLCLACNELESLLYSAGNSADIFITSIHKNASCSFEGKLTVRKHLFSFE